MFAQLVLSVLWGSRRPQFELTYPSIEQRCDDVFAWEALNGRSFPCGLLHNNHIGLGSHRDGSDFGGCSLEKGEKRRPELRTSDTELFFCVVHNSYMSSMSSPGDVKAVMRMKMKAGNRKVQVVLE